MIGQNLTDIGYLTTEQALADFAVFLEHIKQTIPGAQKSPVVAFGGSYGGLHISTLDGCLLDGYDLLNGGMCCRNVGHMVQDQISSSDSWVSDRMCGKDGRAYRALCLAPTEHSPEAHRSSNSRESTTATIIIISLATISKSIRTNVRNRSANHGLPSEK